MPNAQQAFDQKIDEMIVSLLACRGWGKRKQKAKSELLDYLASCGYIHFPGTYRQFLGFVASENKKSWICRLQGKVYCP
jgi:hypothetical protein